MTIRYEANPPKILPDVDKEESISKFITKIKTVSRNCDAIHITENVLGHQRVSPIKVCRLIKKELPDIPITVSLRVRDKTEDEVLEFVQECISIKLDGILILMGDPSQTGKPDSGLIPSATVKKLKEKDVDSKIDLYLSISNQPNFSKLSKKLDANPKGFMTQVVQSVEQVKNLAENLNEFSIIPIILFPSEKNKKSAEFLNLDLRSYSEKFEKLVENTHKITGDILITSPSDFIGVNQFLEKLSSSS